MDEYNSDLARQKQAEYCVEHGPHFAPKSGRCWKCDRDIYQKIGWKIENGRAIEMPLDSPDAKHFTGVTVGRAATSLVTGCPHCNRSYCD